MELRLTDHASIDAHRANPKRRAILLTTYMTGSTEGQNLGVAGYSYDFVTQLFLPLLQQWGEVIPVPSPERNLQSAVKQAQADGLDAIHLSFLPLQDVCLAQDAPNVVVPAWEFPDVPNFAFGLNPQNDWPATANRCDLVLVGNPFTENALRKGGTTVPIRVTQVPVPDEYFKLPVWNNSDSTRLDCPGYVLSGGVKAVGCRTPTTQEQPELSMLKEIGKAIERGVSRNFKRLLGKQVYQWIKQPTLTSRTRRKPKQNSQRANIRLPHPWKEKLDVSGIIYTSIFNPNDGRKNWQDLLTGFLFALGDCEDATLVIKLITSNQQAIRRVIDNYIRRDIPHRCNLVFVTDYLNDEQMLQLAENSTYYLQTTRAEGNCLPLMNFLAAGRPGISPAHSAIADYFDEDIGFVVESHPEPAAWPHDPNLRTRSTWGRLVWPSLVEQIRASYDLAKYDRAAYEAMGQRGKTRLEEWSSVEAIWPRLEEALDTLFPAQATTLPLVAPRRMVA